MATVMRAGIVRMLVNNAQRTAVRTISTKETRKLEKRPPRPAPWDYRNRTFNYIHYLYDSTTKRFDDNTKVIVVEGPIASGKTAFAKDLAKQLDMSYYPEANQDMHYINSYGYDLRQLDSEVPESTRSFDINNFLCNPRHRLTASFQIKQYGVKYSQYIDALAHLLHTGEGVVLDRCVYSDFVFMEAMYASGYISKGARSVYYDVRKNSIRELMHPHLVIYLDVPVEKVKHNIKKRALSYEVNSTALTDKYLCCMEDMYKTQYLKEIANRSELLIYDWSEQGDIEVVLEDIEQIDFDRFQRHDSQLKDWRLREADEEWADLRNWYAQMKPELQMLLNVPRFDVPELVTDADDALAYRNRLSEAPGEKFAPGFNRKMGDDNVFLKNILGCSTLPKRERRTKFDPIPA